MTNKIYEQGKRMVEEIYETKLKLLNFSRASIKTEQEMEEIENNMFALVSTERSDSTGKYIYSNSEMRKAETRKRLMIHKRFTEWYSKKNIQSRFLSRYFVNANTDVESVEKEKICLDEYPVLARLSLQL